MASGIGKRVFDNIDQVLLCQICLNPMIDRKARLLSCLHTFCQVCLETILTRKPGRKISCSICRQDTELPTGQVSDLPLNFNIDQVNQMGETLVQTAACSKCYKKKEYVPATQICITCSRQMCDTCRKQHDKLPGFLAHQIERLGHQKSGVDQQNCKTHKSPICLFCRKCKLLLCSQCMTDDVHDSHTDDIQSLDAAMSEIQTSLSDRKRDVVKHLNFVKEKTHVKSGQLKHLASVERDIIRTMNSLKSSIDKSGNDLIKELKDNYMAKIEQQKAHLAEMVKRGTSSLKTLQDFEMNKTVRMLDSSDSWIKDALDFEQLMSGLKNGVDIAMVKFTKQLQVSVIGKLEKIDLPPEVREPDRRDLLTPGDLIKLSKQLSNTAGAKPTMVKSYEISLSSVYRFSDVATMGDGSAVFTGGSNDEILRINHQGDIVSRYKHDGGDKIKSFSAFNDTIVCTFDKESKLLELTFGHEQTTSTKLRGTPGHGIKADGVCVDCSGNITLYGEKAVTKLDGRDNIVWQKTVRETCDRVKSGLLDNKQCYLTNYYPAKKTKIWNEAGEVIGTLKYPHHQHHLYVYDMTVSHRGTFIVTHRCTLFTFDDCCTVTEYAPDGSFIRHLVTPQDGVRWPYRVSCDQQGCMWITDPLSQKIHIYKLS